MATRGLAALAVFYAFFVSCTFTATLDSWWDRLQRNYITHNETFLLLQAIEQGYPDIAKIYSIGKSVQGRDLWVIKVGSDISRPRPLLRPMVKLVANIHGDEALGRQLLLLLAVRLLTRWNETDSRIVRLLSGTEVHLLPSINPDGYEASTPGSCHPDPDLLGRKNANSVDLNRDFLPEENQARATGRQPETMHMMDWIRKEPFILSASLHGGSVVVNYPFDTAPPGADKEPGYDNSGIPNPSPDELFFRHISRKYASAHRTMATGNDCGEKFPEGITNGAAWYVINGGMQDFNYLYSNCYEVTIELSCCKYPSAATIPQEWTNNEEAFLQFLEQADSGVKGFITDVNGNVPEDAAIEVKGIDHYVKATKASEYWRLLAPGKYQIRARSGSQVSPWKSVDVKEGGSQVVNFTIAASASTSNGVGMYASLFSILVLIHSVVVSVDL